jgi:hypothetical protein
MLRLQPARATSQRSTARVLIAFALALVAHAGLVALLLVAALVKLDLPEHPKPRRASAAAVTLRGVTAEQWNKNRNDAPSRV